MPFNVLGPDEAVDALRRDIEGERAKDPGYTWSFRMHEVEGPILDGDPMFLTKQQHRQLLALSRHHPGLVIVTGQIDRDSDTGETLSVDLLRYAKGRRRMVASYGPDVPDRCGQQVRLLNALLRYDGDRKLERRSNEP
jgi:hypothetical protein